MEALRDGRILPAHGTMRWRGVIEDHLVNAGIARWVPQQPPPCPGPGAGADAAARLGKADRRGHAGAASRVHGGAGMTASSMTQTGFCVDCNHDRAHTDAEVTGCSWLRATGRTA
jgi:hypothetical protein